jgi:glycosyltransferase involved in cell wall biosynthesis
MNREGNYNRGLRLLKRTTRKNDLRYLALPLRHLGNFPRYDLTRKLNGVSVIVCTYNGASRLADTIRHIAKQKVSPEILWEVILVDNASTDNSKEVTINEWKKHNCRAKLIVVDQPVPGKQLALEKGYEVSKYEYWITCDDDNWLDENFVQLTYDIMSKNPRIGALGGPNEPLCEVKPPEWFNYFKRDYAGGPQPDVHTGIVSEGNITWKRGYVWGAGMIVRRSAWEQLLRDGFRTSMTCRKGTELSSGGDSEACYALVLAGWEIWYDSRLKLVHCMPGGRLVWDYLVRLFRGFGKATVGLELYEKAIQLAHADADDDEINKQDWKYEFRKSLGELKKYGIRKILSLRHPQDDNTDLLMLEFHLEKLKELWKSRKEYDKNFNALKNAPWKKDFKYLKGQHRKYIESENDFRYGWPWSENTYRSYNDSQDKTDLPKISILSPSFNSEGTIEKAILSVLNQGYPNFEMIICDGGSTDGTVEILKKYPQVKWISEPDKGQSDAMNKAFNMSTGDIIAYLNVDDYFQRGAFFEVARRFKQNPDAEMLISNLFFEFADHTFTRVPEIEYKKIMLPFRYMFPINPVSYFYKRHVQEKIGPFPLDNHFTMDYWFLLKAYQDFKFIQTDYHLGTFCMNGYNKTSNADNRKNTHVRVMYHCWHYDRKMLPYYMYNYYKHFYYDIKPWNLKSIGYKTKRFLSRIYSVLTFRKNKYYSGRLYERGRYRYYEKKRIRSLMWTVSSFAVYPKNLKSAERWNTFLPALLGEKYGEKAKNVYRFLAYPPGMSLAHKLNYYGNEYKKAGKGFKGKLVLFLAFVASPRYYMSKGVTAVTPSGKIVPFTSKGMRLRSQELFDKAGYYYSHKRRFRSLLWVMLSLAAYPGSSGQRSRRTLLVYSALGEKFATEANILRHLYLDDKQYSFPYKLNYFGNRMRKEGRNAYGNLLLAATYIMSPKYIKTREKVEKKHVVISSQVQDIKIKPVSNIKENVPDENSATVKSTLRLKAGRLDAQETYRAARYKVQLFYEFFRYRKFKAISKNLYSDAMNLYHDGKRSKVPGLVLRSFFLYPPSLFKRNKWSLLMNSVLSDSTMKKIKGIIKR